MYDMCLCILMFIRCSVLNLHSEWERVILRVFELVKCLLRMHSGSSMYMLISTLHVHAQTDRGIAWILHTHSHTRTRTHSRTHPRAVMPTSVRPDSLSRSSSQLALSSRKPAHDASIQRILDAFFAQVACVLEGAREWVCVCLSLSHMHLYFF